MTSTGKHCIVVTSLFIFLLVSFTASAELLFERPWANFLAISPTGNGGMCVVGLGGEIWSLSPGAAGKGTRQESSVDLEWFNGVSFLADGRSGWIAGSDGSVLSTQNGGRRWDRRVLPGAALMDIYAVSERIVLVCGVGGMVLRTENGGLDWKRVDTGVSTILTRFARVPQSNTIRLVGGGGVALSSEDEGLTWQRLTTPTTELLFDSCWLSRTNGWICGQAGTVLSTDDGGGTWTARGPRVTHEFCTISFCDENDGVLAGGSVTGDSVVYVTRDGGLSWSQKKDFRQIWWKDSLCDGSGRIILVGNDRVIVLDDLSKE